MTSGRWLSPLVRDHNRIGRDMIVVVKIIAGRLVREALKRYECQLATIMLKKEQGLTYWKCRVPSKDTINAKQWIANTAAYR